ncbi:MULTISPECIES: DUF3017 domain-containing protein [Kitasatospora]|uniref:DUF3017 domain-containing protein n=1 Tax=Kitasatospora TaxID=2063 RepID=UPI000C6FE358|nr:DUF3017 domain-containing protein [Kitasatospora sp. GP30]MDH6140773.1 uncharacterized membrane protein YjjP (DUF1212 family) [Kitasatospora sp. GP30]
MSAVRTSRSTRRRPSTTTGTLPPEGSRAALDRGHPLPIRQWPITLVTGVVGAGLLVTWASDFRYGLLVVGAGFLLGALLRLTRPEVGLLAVRSRFTDVAVLLFFGLVIVLLALMAPQDPWLRLPALDDLGRWIGSKH